MGFCEEVNFGLEIRSPILFELRDRCSRNSHDLLWEFVNSIMNFMFMTILKLQNTENHSDEKHLPAVRDEQKVHRGTLIMSHLERGKWSS